MLTSYLEGPIGNDRPLTEFKEMPFVSVATSSEEGDPEGVSFWVGEREAGTASVLRELVREVSRVEQAALPAGEVLAAAMRNLGVTAWNRTWK